LVDFGQKFENITVYLKPQPGHHLHLENDVTREETPHLPHTPAATPRLSSSDKTNSLDSRRQKSGSQQQKQQQSEDYETVYEDGEEEDEDESEYDDSDEQTDDETESNISTQPIDLQEHKRKYTLNIEKVYQHIDKEFEQQQQQQKQQQQQQFNLKPLETKSMASFKRMTQDPNKFNPNFLQAPIYSQPVPINSPIVLINNAPVAAAVRTNVNSTTRPPVANIRQIKKAVNSQPVKGTGGVTMDRSLEAFHRKTEVASRLTEASSHTEPVRSDQDPSNLG